MGLLARAGMASLLARIHALVGELQRIVDRACLVWKEDGSARRSHGKRLPTFLERVPAADTAVWSPSRMRGIKHAELVAPEPIGASDRGDRRLELVTEPRQERIAGDVAERVVVGLEAVEVEQHQEQR